MDNLGVAPTIAIQLFTTGKVIYLNYEMLIMTYVVIAFLALTAFFGTKKLRQIPGKTQNMLEIIYEFTQDITFGTLGKKDGASFVPLIFTIFVFVLAANWIGILPHLAQFIGVVLGLIHYLFTPSAGEFIYQGLTNVSFIPNPSSAYYFLFNIPAFQEPTRSINTDLALGILVFLVVHINSVRKHGWLDYFRSYMGDIVPSKGWWVLLFPINPFFYLNVISEVSSVVSHSFRLFGNIFGGFMILVIVSSLVKHFLVPVGLLAFFGIFAGIVQAFVFTMLAVTYIGQKN